LRFLEAIDRGDYTVLPEPYIRAFIRSYARTVGLDPNQIIKEFELEVRPVKEEGEVEESKEVVPRLNPSVLAGGIVISVILLILVWIILTSKSGEEETVQRKSFESAVEEISGGKSSGSIRYDSLELELIATDTVWLSVLIDSTMIREFLLNPNSRLKLRAMNGFVFTIGNAGGLRMILNGYELGRIGRTGRVVRNFVVDWKKLKSLIGGAPR
jgi:hypothetical protein